MIEPPATWALVSGAVVVDPDNPRRVVFSADGGKLVAVVIGGGVSLAGRTLFFDPVEATVAQYVFPPFRGQYQLLSAALGEAMVVHGAIALAADAEAASAG